MGMKPGEQGSDETLPPLPVTPRRRSRLIVDWRPEDAIFWSESGRRIAAQNLWISIPALFLAFAVWMVWSVVVVKLNQVGFAFTESELFWLAALPALSGATLRIFYSFVVPVFGGRSWTAISTASLLLPAVGIGLAVQNPETPYRVFVLLALLCGLGGGNFASSMANINYFYPKARKGTALGLNAGIGNLGVSAMQFVVPIVIATGAFAGLVGAPQIEVTAAGARQIWLQNAGFVWVPFIVLIAVAAWVGMHNLAGARASVAEQSIIFRRKHNWLMCWLYLGTFGSFIGYSAAFPRVIQTQFPAVDPLQFAFLGPLVGAAIRPVGGWISDRFGGARVTFWNFFVMALAAGGVIYFVRAGDRPGAFIGFLVMFLVLFTTTGIGNGSTFRMIPVIFLNQHTKGLRDGEAIEIARRNAEREASAVLGFTSAIGAYGGFFIPLSYGYSIERTGSPETALWGFIVFYITCIAVTWWYYFRRDADAPC
jgi:MFS transporter, NNP family, nitrate/nitrite transporter